MNDDQKTLERAAQLTRRQAGADRVVVMTVNLDGRVALAGGGYQGAEPHVISEMSVDLLRSAASLLPPTMSVVVRTPEGDVEVHGGRVTGIAGEVVQ